MEDIMNEVKELIRAGIGAGSWDEIFDRSGDHSWLAYVYANRAAYRGSKALANSDLLSAYQLMGLEPDWNSGSIESIHKAAKKFVAIMEEEAAK